MTETAVYLGIPTSNPADRCGRGNPARMQELLRSGRSAAAADRRRRPSRQRRRTAFRRRTHWSFRRRTRSASPGGCALPSSGKGRIPKKCSKGLSRSRRAAPAIAATSAPGLSGRPPSPQWPSSARPNRPSRRAILKNWSFSVGVSEVAPPVRHRVQDQMRTDAGDEGSHWSPCHRSADQTPESTWLVTNIAPLLQMGPCDPVHEGSSLYRLEQLGT